MIEAFSVGGFFFSMGLGDVDVVVGEEALLLSKALSILSSPWKPRLGTLKVKEA